MVEHSLHVGAVYTHALTGARGVVVGWDERARAPREWLVANLPGKRSWADQMRRLYAPHYSVLEEIDKPDGSKRFMKRYIVALCREDDPAPCPRVATPAQPLHHPDIAQYFGAFDPQRGYLPTAELAALYPDG